MTLPVTREEKLIKLHRVAYFQILLKSVEDRTEEETNFFSWYEEKHTEEANMFKNILMERGLNFL